MCQFYLYHKVTFLYLGFIPQLSLELSGTQTDIHGIFFHRKLLMLTTDLQHRQLPPVVSSQATGASSISGGKQPGLAKGQKEKGEFYF